MITSEQKQSIVSAIEREKGLLGSYNKVAAKLGVSPAAVTNNMLKAENWTSVSESTWKKAAAALSVSLAGGRWTLAQTTNVKLMQGLLSAAQEQAMFIAISDKAGSGKTASIRAFREQDSTASVFVLECEEWNRRQFLLRLLTELGERPEGEGYHNIDRLQGQVVKFFKQRVSRGVTPLLILDEADKLKPAALRFLIPFYNKLEDEAGIVIAGTENLEKEVERGRAKAIKGYDEISSRLGRNFFHLTGATLEDVALICRANGVESEAAIDRIWKEVNPTRKDIRGRYVQVVEDLRRVKRLVQREKISINS